MLAAIGLLVVGVVTGSQAGRESVVVRGAATASSTASQPTAATPDDPKDHLLVRYRPPTVSHWQTTVADRPARDDRAAHRAVTQSFHDRVDEYRAYAADLSGHSPRPTSTQSLIVTSLLGDLDQHRWVDALLARPGAEAVRVRGDRPGVRFQPDAAVTAIQWLERPGLVIAVNGVGIDDDDLFRVVAELVEIPAADGAARP